MVSVLAYNILALIARCIKRVHEPATEVSFFHLVVQTRSGYEGTIVALPPEYRLVPPIDVSDVVDRLLQLAKRITPKSTVVSKTGA